MRLASKSSSLDTEENLVDVLRVGVEEASEELAVRGEERGVRGIRGGKNRSASTED